MNKSMYVLPAIELPTVLGVSTGLLRHGLETELPITYITCNSLNKGVYATPKSGVS